MQGNDESIVPQNSNTTTTQPRLRSSKAKPPFREGSGAFCNHFRDVTKMVYPLTDSNLYAETRSTEGYIIEELNQNDRQWAGPITNPKEAG